jgi:hypothetical protein
VAAATVAFTATGAWSTVAGNIAATVAASAVADATAVSVDPTACLAAITLAVAAKSRVGVLGMAWTLQADRATIINMTIRGFINPSLGRLMNFKNPFSAESPLAFPRLFRPA